MSRLKLSLYIGAVVSITVAVLGIAGRAYYKYVYVPAHEEQWRREARIEWPELVARRRGKVPPVFGVEMDGELEDARTLLRCFKVGEPAAEVANILATGHKWPDDPDGGTCYTWNFRVPKPEEPDATVLVVAVHIAGRVPIVKYAYGSFTAD